MIDLIFIGLLQAVAGDPAPAQQPAATPAAEQAAPAETPAQADQAPAAPTAAPTQPQMREERVCQSIEITGRRMPQRVCRNVMVPVETPAPAPAPQQER